MTRPPIPTLVLWLALACLPGCVTARMDYGRPLPDADGLARIVPGQTTRAELFDLLGPPDELLSPMPMGPPRIQDPIERRVFVERDVFARQLLTWEHERRRDALLLIFPYFNLFEHWTTRHTRDRVLVELDEAGVVRQLAVSREIE